MRGDRLVAKTLEGWIVEDVGQAHARQVGTGSGSVGTCGVVRRLRIRRSGGRGGRRPAEGCCALRDLAVPGRVIDLCAAEAEGQATSAASMAAGDGGGFLVRQFPRHLLRGSDRNIHTEEDEAVDIENARESVAVAGSGAGLSGNRRIFP